MVSHGYSDWWTKIKAIWYSAFTDLRRICAEPFAKARQLYCRRIRAKPLLKTRQARCRLLEIPGEIRTQIYREIFLSKKTRSCRIGMLKPLQPIGILCVNRQIRREALHFPVSPNRINICVGPHWWRISIPKTCSAVTSFEFFLCKIYTSGLDLDRIENVELEMYWPCAWPSPPVNPTDNQMANSGSLRTNLATVCNVIESLPNLRNIDVIWVYKEEGLGKPPRRRYSLQRSSSPLRALRNVRRYRPDVNISFLDGDLNRRQSGLNSS